MSSGNLTLINEIFTVIGAAARERTAAPAFRQGVAGLYRRPEVRGKGRFRRPHPVLICKSWLPESMKTAFSREARSFYNALPESLPDGAVKGRGDRCKRQTAKKRPGGGDSARPGLHTPGSGGTRNPTGDVHQLRKRCPWTTARYKGCRRW